MEHLIWNIDPVLISFGSIKIHWYGVLFSAAILFGLQIMKWIYKQEDIELDTLDTLLGYVVVGIIVGARLGHCLFYDPSYYLAHPMKILAIWEGGLASHGGGLGVILAIGLYVKKYKVSYLWLLDRLAIGTAVFGVFVRTANFINSEILGVQTDKPWGIIFARIDNIPRHPAQLYEAFAYLFILFALLALYKKYKSKSPNGLLLGTFLILVFTARFLIELVKQKQAAYTSEFMLNTGQMLSIPFFIAGIILVIFALKNSTQQTKTPNKK